MFKYEFKYIFILHLLPTNANFIDKDCDECYSKIQHKVEEAQMEGKKEVFAVVFEDNPKELAGVPALFTQRGDAEHARNQWNSDVGMCETRSVTVAPMPVA